MSVIGLKFELELGIYYTVEFPIQKLSEIKNVDGLIAIEIDRPMVKELDESRKMIKLDEAFANFTYRGKDVIIGIVDTGIDIYHPTFQDETGNTRILYIWDQNDDTGPGPIGNDLGGTEWNTAQINSGSCTHLDKDGHGTHVAGIAAGDGKEGATSTPYVGVAPEADIIMVSRRSPGTSYLNQIYSTTVNVLEGIKYIADKAKTLNKPWVANLSFGLDGGPRDGTSRFEKAISELTSNSIYGKGRIIVKSAGNSGYIIGTSPISEAYKKIHADHNGAGMKEFFIDIKNEIAGNGGFIEIYYEPTDNYSVKLTAPDGSVYGPIAKGDPLAVFDSGNDGFITISNLEGENDIRYKPEDNIITITIFDNEGNGTQLPSSNGTTWKLEMIGSSGEWDAYVKSDNNAHTSFYFHDGSYSNRRLISEPGNAANVITVGSMNSKNSWTNSTGGTSTVPNHPISTLVPTYSSSPGPSRSGIDKPDVFAPGALIASAASGSKEVPYPSAQLASNPEYVHLSGTSMATPHVTGLVALLLEQRLVDLNKTTSYVEILNLLKSNLIDGKVINADATLTASALVVGIEDRVKFNTYYCGSSANQATIEPGISYNYCAVFIDEAPKGDYAISYDWKLELYHSGGTYIAGTGSTGQGSESSWLVTVNSSDLLDKSWARDESGNIKGKVIVTAVDNDGVSHRDDMNIGIKYVPNKPIIYNHTVTNSSITFSLLGTGATNYKIYYSTSPGPPYNGTGANQGNSPINIGTSTTYTLSGLDFANNTYYFSATGINSEGESQYANDLIIGDPILSYDIVWTNLDDVIVNGNTLTKSSSVSAWWNAGASSVNELPANHDGWVEMTVQETNTHRMFGLSDVDQGSTWNSIDYNFYLQPGGSIKIYQSGDYEGSFGSYQSGDIVRVEREGSQIKYKLNGNVLYTSSCNPAETLVADVSMYTPGSTISNAKASFVAEVTPPVHDVTWTDLVNTTANGNDLTKTSGSNTWWNGGAASVNTIPGNQDGWFETTVQETNTFRMFGLSSSNPSYSWNTIEYCFYLYSGGTLNIYESGTSKGTFGSYQSGDVVRIERQGSQILYRLNGQTVYTSSCNPAQPLLADISMYSIGGTIYDAKSSVPASPAVSLFLQPSTMVENKEYKYEYNLSDSTLLAAESSILTPNFKFDEKIIKNEALWADSTNIGPLAKIIAFPNPSNGLVHLSYDSSQDGSILVLVNSETTGRDFYRQQWRVKHGKNKTKLNLSLLPNGLYIIKFFDGKNESFLRIKKE